MIDALRRRLPQMSSRPAVSAFRAESTRLVRSRSTWGAVVVFAAMTIGLAVLVAVFVTSTATPGMQIVFAVLKSSMLAAAVFGAVAVTGANRVPVDAAPRPSVLAARAAALAVLIFLLAAASYTGSVLAARPILAGKGMPLDLWNISATWIPVFAASVSTALIGVIGSMIGTVLPSRPRAVAATVGALFALPMIVGIASLAAGGQPWVYDLVSVLPLAAAKNVVFADEPGTGQFPSLMALALLGAWALAAGWGAWARVRRRAGNPAVEHPQPVGARPPAQG
jgi:ABC-2 type transport system permease protein